MPASAALHLVHQSPTRDLDAAEHAASKFLCALGISLDSENLRDTPARMARGYAELLTPRPFDPTTFPNDENYDELVLSRKLPVRSVCEHHLLPFIGVAHVGYLPGSRIIGLSKLARLVEHFACQPQVRNASPNRSPSGSHNTCNPAASGCSSKPNTPA